MGKLLVCVSVIIMCCGIASKPVTAFAVETVSATVDEDTYRMLCKCVEAEAGNQDVNGRRAVAEVILNRVDDVRFPNTIKEVIQQKGQFSSWSNGAFNKAIITRETQDAVNVALEERTYPMDMLWFRTGQYHGWGTPYSKIGDHYFSTS